MVKPELSPSSELEQTLGAMVIEDAPATNCDMLDLDSGGSCSLLAVARRNKSLQFKVLKGSTVLCTIFELS